MSDIFEGATDKETRTKIFHNWMKNSGDDVKRRYAINWTMPHTLFNVSCNFFKGEDIQNIDWESIHNSRDLGKWSNNNKVNVI